MKSPLCQGSPCRPAALRFLFCICALVLLVGVQSASANINGSIFTTFGDGTTVNGNLFPSKSAVYLNGGPQNESSKGLPDGLYYYQVTDPSGSVLLSTDDVTCRQLQVVGGIVFGVPTFAPPVTCTTGFHANGTQNNNNGGSIPVQLIPFNDTPNTGGEYKVWLIPQADYDPSNATNPKKNFGFQNGDTKTDNFKVAANAAVVKVCKFNDLNDDTLQDNGEPLIPHWPITATGVTGGPVSAQTDDNGCIAFTVTTFSNGDGTQTVTLTETVLNGWTQTAPVDGTCTLTANSGTVNAADACNVSGGVITITVSPNDNVSVPDFGNNNCGGQACQLSTLVVTKDANPSFTRTFKWGITKAVTSVSNCTVGGNPDFCTPGSETINYSVSVTHDSGTDSAWEVTGTIKVSNPTGSAISGVTVSDAVDNGGSCTVDTSGFNGTVPANNHVLLPYTCTYSSLPSPGTNTATANFDSSSASGTAIVDFAGATINLVDDSVTVTDTLGGTLGTVSSTDPSPTTFTYSKTFTDTPGTCTTHNNTATFTTDTTSSTGSDSKSVTVCVGADLTVSKTAAAAFNSAITKAVDKALVEQSGGTITFNYTVTVTTSGWTVSGNITVTNPNNWESITANVADVLSDSGGVCTVAGGGIVTVAASSSQTVAYSCSFALVPTAGSGTNTATATWNAATAFTPDGSASGSAGYTFPTLTITDTFNNVTTTLGTVTIPPGSATFKYPRTINNSSPGTCTSYTNTAQIVGGGSASQTVTVCNTNTGALTMGFWQNKNGQGIINNFCGGTSGTSLNAFLTQFNPFQDLTATTCSGDASYVLNIIKAATCTSTSNTCNKMLRAQMLATALDVYFSTPSLGGNRIGAFNGLGNSTPALGGVAIDLSKVCAMIDGSGGGSCSGTFEDARPEFGIAPPALGTTVLQMLFYSDFNSGVNGSPVATSPSGATWYNNNKSRQVIAKDAFDAINNQVALIAPPTPASNITSPSF